METEDLLEVLDMCTRAEEIITDQAILSDEFWEDIRQYKGWVYTKADSLISKGFPAEVVQYFVDLYIKYTPYVEKLIKYREDN